MKTKKLLDLSPEELERQKTLKIWMEHHGKPMSRRQLLASGAILGAAGLILSPLQMLTNIAHAQSCDVSSDMPAFFNINLNGGASLASNVVVRDAGGDYMQHYGTVGLGSTSALTATERPIFGPQSMSLNSTNNFFTGITGAASPQVLANTSMFIVAVESTDDSAGNEFNATPMIAKVKAGSNAFLPPLGNNRNAPAVLPAVPALSVGSLTDIQNAIGVNGAVQQLSSTQKSRLFRAVNRLSESQSRQLASTSGGDLLADLVQSATGTNTSLVASPGTGLNPANVTGFNQVWNLNNGEQARDASVALNTLNGNSVAGYIEMGGYDYHALGRNVQTTRDTAAGTKIGQMLSSAALVGKKLFMTVTTDGGIVHNMSDTAGSPAANDRGQNGMIMVFMYDPAGRPAISGPQVGNFKNGNNNTIGVDTDTPVGGSATLATAAVVANYLAFAGRGAGAIEAVAPRLFDTEQLDQVVKVAG